MVKSRAPKAAYFFILGFALLILAILVERFFLRNRPLDISRRTGQESSQILSKDTKLKDVLNNQITTLDKFTGKVTLINFWASWCEACMVEMPSIQKLYAILKSEGFEVLAINLDDNPPKIVPSIVKSLGLTFPIYLDTDATLAKQFEVVGIPFNAIIDKKLNIVWAEGGERDWATDEVISQIRNLINQK